MATSVAWAPVATSQPVNIAAPATAFTVGGRLLDVYLRTYHKPSQLYLGFFQNKCQKMVIIGTQNVYFQKLFKLLYMIGKIKFLKEKNL